MAYKKGDKVITALYGPGTICKVNQDLSKIDPYDHGQYQYLIKLDTPNRYCYYTEHGIGTGRGTCRLFHNKEIIQLDESQIVTIFKSINL